jgi:uncharacterized protein YsxB (DUF464 family)
MLKVMIDTEGDTLSLKIEGHAEYAEHGKDIVCAAASILISTLAYKIRVKDRYFAFKEPPVTRLEAGDTEISCTPQDFFCSDCRSDFEFVKTGFFLLEQNYPQNVELITDAEDD